MAKKRGRFKKFQLQKQTIFQNELSQSTKETPLNSLIKMH